MLLQLILPQKLLRALQTEVVVLFLPVRRYMPFQVAFLREPFRTHRTNVLFSCMNQPVNLVRIVVSIALAADIARERLDSIVQHIVSFQIGFLSEALKTYITHVLFARMYGQMGLQRVLIGEPLTTQPTPVGPVFGVVGVVSFKVRLLGEGPKADIADVFLARVDLFMHLEGILVCEGLLAGVADIRLLCTVGQLMALEVALVGETFEADIAGEGFDSGMD